MKRKKTINILILAALVLIFAVLVLTRPSEAEKIAAEREKFSTAFKKGDYESAAEAVNKFSRLRGTTMGPEQVLEEISPVGSSAAFPIESLDVCADFIERRLFYSEIAASAAAGEKTQSERILAVFDWTVRNVWPTEVRCGLSGADPREIALAGAGSDLEISWLFCTILENVGVDAVLFNVKFAGEEKIWPLVAAGMKTGSEKTDEQWYLFAPGEGLPLVKDDGSSVATLKDFLKSEARIPDEEPVVLQTVEFVGMLIAAEPQVFLPAAGDLEKLMKKNGCNFFHCHKTTNELSNYGRRIFASAKGTNTKIRAKKPELWGYPFNLGKMAEHAGNAGLSTPEGVYFKAKAFHLTGKHAEALQVLAEPSGSGSALLAAAAMLESGEYEKALNTLKDLGTQGGTSDAREFIAGNAFLALGRTNEAVESFKKITGPRAALGNLLAGKAQAGEKPLFKIGEE